jgi:hypothetical protein
MVAMPGSSALYAIYLLAFARLVLLVCSDVITRKPRQALVDALEERGHEMIAYLVTCPWCVSIWMAIPAGPIIYAYGHHWWLFVPALVMALSGAAGVLARVKG